MRLIKQWTLWLMVLSLLALVTGCGAATFDRAPGAKMRTSVGAPELAAPSADGMGMIEADEEQLYASAAGSGDASADPAARNEPPPPPPAASPQATPAGAGAPGPTTLAKPLLIYTANVVMAVFEARQGVERVHALAEKMGGYLVQRSDRQITVRIPSDKFYGSLQEIEKLGDVLQRDENVRDVTEEFHDLKTRLQNARATRDRLEQLLTKADKVDDVLAIEKELSRVTEYIERMEGKLKRLRELVAYSTITVRFDAKPTDKIDSKVELPFSWLRDLGLNSLLNLH